MKKITLAVLVCALTSGCAVKKEWSATGGSRSDGTIKLSYQYGLFEQPMVDREKGIQIASDKCKSWGYESAEAFGGVMTNCNNFTQNGCISWLVTADYQCLGNLDKSKTTALTNQTNGNETKENVYDHLKGLQRLKEEGIITEEEFKASKLRLLNGQ